MPFRVGAQRKKPPQSSFEAGSGRRRCHACVEDEAGGAGVPPVVGRRPARLRCI